MFKAVGGRRSSKNLSNLAKREILYKRPN